MQLIKALQDYLGANISKIDPNTQDLKEEDFTHRYDKLAQAAVPAVLSVLYKYTHTDDGAAKLINSDISNNLLPELLNRDYTDVVSKVATYASFNEQYVSKVMDNLTFEAVKLLKEQSNNDPEKLQGILSDQRHDILTHLPASLEMGKTLDDTTMDDRTNKMEGPISNLLHTIENAFSSSPVKK